MYTLPRKVRTNKSVKCFLGKINFRQKSWIVSDKPSKLTINSQIAKLKFIVIR